MRKQITKTTGLVRVEVDSRDGSQDRIVPASIVKEKTDAGELSYDLTNHMPCTPENGICPPWLSLFPKI